MGVTDNSGARFLILRASTNLWNSNLSAFLIKSTHVG